LEIGAAGLHNRPEAGLLEIECDTLDNILGEQRVDVMKIDIEGAEVSALKGTTKTMKHFRIYNRGWL
jgi:FkbM family methyltransferase